MSHKPALRLPKNARWGVFAFVAICLLGLGELRADILAGPATLPFTGGANVYWGLQFHANNTSLFTGFDFSHLSSPTNRHSGIITLTDVTGPPSTVYSTSFTNDGTPTLHFSPNVLLTAGHNYQLINTQTGGLFSDALRNGGMNFYTAAFSLPNHDIKATVSLYDGFSTDQFTWLAFRNLTTNAVPEPASLLAWGVLSGVAFVGSRLRRRMTQSA